MKRALGIIIGVLVVISVISAARNAVTERSVRSIEIPPMDIELQDGLGRDLTRGYCGICHSLDYITMQPKFPAEKWKAIVNRMIKVLGAPIGEGDAEIITNYITRTYGAEN